MQLSEVHSTPHIRAYQGNLKDLVIGPIGYDFERVAEFLREEDQFVDGMELKLYGGHVGLIPMQQPEPDPFHNYDGIQSFGYRLLKDTLSGKTGSQLKFRQSGSVDELSVVLQAAEFKEEPEDKPGQHLTYNLACLHDRDDIGLQMFVAMSFGSVSWGGLTQLYNADFGSLVKILQDVREIVTGESTQILGYHSDGAFNIMEGETFLLQPSDAETYSWVHNNARTLLQGMMATEEYNVLSHSLKSKRTDEYTTFLPSFAVKVMGNNDLVRLLRVL